MRKLLVILLLFVPLLWLTWGWRPVSDDPRQALVRIEDLTAGVTAADRSALGPLALEGLWRLSARHHHFGGYSALVALDKGGLLAISDRNAWLKLAQSPVPGETAMPAGRLIAMPEGKGAYFGFDIESAVRDPADGSLWLGLEAEAHVARIGPAKPHLRFYGVRVLRRWPENGGAEAMTRLIDGRWVMLCESCAHEGNGAHTGLLVAGRPGQSAMRKFAIAFAQGFDPVDMVTLPDGRVLILTRKFERFPPRFVSRIVLADMTRVPKSGPLATRELARIDGQSVRENYEGMAIRADTSGKLTMWLIADANGTAIQETRLMKLVLDPARLH